MENYENKFVCHLAAGQSGTSFSLHFNQLLPRLSVPMGHMPHFTINLLSLSPVMRNGVSKRLAKMNAGRLPVELTDPINVFRGFLNSLSEVDGLIGIGQSNRYTIDFETGLLFDSVAIAHRIGKLVHESFYWDYEFQFSMDTDFRRPGQTMVNGSSLDIGSVDSSRDEAPF